MGDPVNTSAETTPIETSPSVGTGQGAGSPKRSARKRRVRPAAPREREHLARAHLAEREAYQPGAEVAQAEGAGEGSPVVEPPPPPVDPEKTRAAVEGYVRLLLCGVNLGAARVMGYLPIDREDYQSARDSIASEAAAMCPDGLARSVLFRVGGFGARFVAKHLERLTGIEGPPLETTEHG